MRKTHVGESERSRQTWIDLTSSHHRVVRRALFIVGEVRALETFLTHPEVAEVHRRVIPGRPGADDHHASVVADEDRCWDGVFTRVLEDDPRIATLSEDVPQR